MSYCKTALLATNYVLLFYCVHGFNLSPQPNYIFGDPNFTSFIPKVQSSYFGYSINLRSNSVMVGAPRAQSSLESQRDVNETGAIYKCTFNSSSCQLFVMDNSGNGDGKSLKYLQNSEIKDQQWLGASMDGNFEEGGPFVACAPRIQSQSKEFRTNMMHGVCYYTPNTVTSTLTNVRKMAPLQKKADQYKYVGTVNHFFHIFGEQGISVHITENNEEILIGAPGVLQWKGTIIRYKAKQKRRRKGQGQNKYQFPNDFDVSIPDPIYWGQPDPMYFGYALASGYFEGFNSHKILYVTSAPQANLQQGEVYIFDIVDNFAKAKTIKIYHTFASYQMGEYFGYALAAGDFNGDGFDDLAICAPFNSKDESYENGAVYIYQNLGESIPSKKNLNFVKQSDLRSDYKSGGGRFGSSISKLGDLNLDGYNDIAIGAPYEENGAVYIYLGGPNGLVSKPSQRLTAPFNKKVAPFTPHMFGHSLSKGSDIDGNSYLDLAVGAPNAETVYVYRSYPVVKVIANVYPLSKELKINDTSLKFRTCWSIESKVLNQTKIEITIEVDKKFERVRFTDKTNQLEVNRTATTKEQCEDYDAVVQFSPAHVFKPIEIEMKHSILDKVPDSGVFCSQCVAVNPIDSTETQTKVVFITGCGNPKCVANLRLSSTVLSPSPYMIGSSNNISLSYKIENFGETAYLAQINISIPETVAFMKIPSNCQLRHKRQLLCNINNGSPLYKWQLGFLNISLDTTNLEGSELLVNATASSTGDESYDGDNHESDRILLAEFSDVEITGKSNKPLLDLQDGAKLENVVFTYEIRNNGPTSLKHTDVAVSIPISFQNRLDVISIENLSVKNEYKNQQFGIEWVESNSSSYQHVGDSSSQSASRYDRSDTGVGSVITIGYTTQSSTPDDAIHNYQNVSTNRNRALESLITNRTILFDCFNSTTTTSRCLQAKFSVNNFLADDTTPLLIQLQFSINLDKVDKLFTKNIDSFVIRPTIGLVRNDDDDGNKMHIVHSYAYTSYTFIWKQGTVGVWVYIVSFVAGLLVLILITYGLYRLGFFRRAKKEKLKILVRQSQIARMPKADQKDD